MSKDMELCIKSCLKYLRMTGAQIWVINRRFSFSSAVAEVRVHYVNSDLNALNYCYTLYFHIRHLFDDTDNPCTTFQFVENVRNLMRRTSSGTQL